MPPSTTTTDATFWNLVKGFIDGPLSVYLGFTPVKLGSKSIARFNLFKMAKGVFERRGGKLGLNEGHVVDDALLAEQPGRLFKLFDLTCVFQQNIKDWDQAKKMIEIAIDGMSLCREV